MDMHYLHFLDIGSITIFLVIAYLSKRLGEALKIAAVYYKLLYVSTGLIIISIVLDTTLLVRIIPDTAAMVTTIALFTRCCAGVLAVFSGLRYWKWLLADLVKH